MRHTICCREQKKRKASTVCFRRVRRHSVLSLANLNGFTNYPKVVSNRTGLPSFARKHVEGCGNAASTTRAIRPVQRWFVSCSLQAVPHLTRAAKAIVLSSNDTLSVEPELLDDSVRSHRLLHPVHPFCLLVLGRFLQRVLPNRMGFSPSRSLLCSERLLLKISTDASWSRSASPSRDAEVFTWDPFCNEPNFMLCASPKVVSCSQ